MLAIGIDSAHLSRFSRESTGAHELLSRESTGAHELLEQPFQSNPERK